MARRPSPLSGILPSATGGASAVAAASRRDWVADRGGSAAAARAVNTRRVDTRGSFWTFPPCFPPACLRIALSLLPDSEHAHIAQLLRRPNRAVEPPRPAVPSPPPSPAGPSPQTPRCVERSLDAMRVESAVPHDGHGTGASELSKSVYTAMYHSAVPHTAPHYESVHRVHHYHTVF